MSDPNSRRRQRLPGPTRQQLDELDALLQRMLALPVNQGDEATEPASRAGTATRTDAGDRPPAPDRFARAQSEPELSPSDEPPRTLVVRHGPQGLSGPLGMPLLPPPNPPVADNVPATPRATPAAPPAPSLPRWWEQSLAWSRWLLARRRVEPPELKPAIPVAQASEAPLAVTPRPARSSEPANRPASAIAHPWQPIGHRLLVEAPRWLRAVIWCNRHFDRLTLRLGGAGRWLRRASGRAVLGWTGLALLGVALGILVLDWCSWSW